MLLFYTTIEVYTKFGTVSFFAYPPEVRKIIYTTNIIEGLNRQFRQVTKSKPSFVKALNILPCKW
jgi:transposase-like protein